MANLNYTKIVFQIFLILIFVFPNVLGIREIKAVLICIIVFTFFIDKFNFGKSEWSFCFLLSIYLLSSCLSIFCGLLQTTNDFIPYVFVSYIAGPIFWTFFLSSYIKKIGLNSLLLTIFIGGLLAALQVIVYYALFDQIPNELKEFLIKDPNVTFIEGMPRTNLNTISTLLFVVPAFICSIGHVDKSIIKTSLVNQSIIITFCVFVFGVASILSGRIALIILLVLSIGYVITCIRLKKLTLIIFLLIGLVAILWLNDINLYVVSEHVVEKIKNYGGEERIEQQEALMTAFLDKPFFGNGHGTEVLVIRNEEKPWQYELFYHAILFHSGLAGLIAFFSLVLYSFWNTNLKLTNHPKLKNFIIYGSFGILFSSFNNPYIEGFESQWMLTLPWAVALTKIRDIKI